MKLTKKQELELVLLDCKRLIEDVVTEADGFGNESHDYTLWACRYTYNSPGIEVSCVAGEPTRYWFDKRISPVELRGIMRQFPETEYFVLRCGGKRPQWKIIEASKHSVEPEKPVLISMTPEQVKEAVLAGKTVHWFNDLYTVAFRNNEWSLDCDSSDSTWGLFKDTGVFANHDGKNFFVA
jgi:hypothetical protein